MTDAITELDASTLSQHIHARKVSCSEVMQAYLARIDALNPLYNAIVNLASHDSLLQQARACDQELANGKSRGWLHGIPQAIKDTGHAAGFPTTFGSTLLKSAVVNQDSLMTARMKSAGCIVIGKTNMPELGLGSHTFNTLFGATPNAWDPSVSAGGSSGGSAVALAQRMLPVADGSDFMGSLRNPAAWNNVFGLRPSQGRVPFLPNSDVWVAQLGTEGPMARSVNDLVALLATQAGGSVKSPLSIPGTWQAPVLPPEPALRQAHLKGLKVAWWGDLGGHLALENGVLSACEAALDRMQAAGAYVSPQTHGFDAASVWRAWLVWRRALVGSKVAALMQLPNAAQELKAEALWEYEQCQQTSLNEFLAASETRSRFLQHMLEQLEQFDAIALPCAQVWPFPVEQRWPQHIAGHPMDTYHRWMEATLYATFAGLPAISLPAGFHANGRWPMGVQLIGKPQGEAALLQLAAGYETLIDDWLSRSPS